MKTITQILLLFTAIAFASCQGEEGPMGPPGEDGINIVGSVYEIKGSFSSSNDYTLYYQFPSNLVDGDVVMVYILWEETSDGHGGTLDVWRPLPQVVYLDEGILQYNFDYTLGDVQIFLGGTVNPVVLTPADTDNQIFRVAVIPADLAKSKSVNLKSFDSVMGAMKLTPDQIRDVKADSRPVAQ